MGTLSRRKIVFTPGGFSIQDTKFEATESRIMSRRSTEIHNCFAIESLYCIYQIQTVMDKQLIHKENINLITTVAAVLVQDMYIRLYAIHLGQIISTVLGKVQRPKLTTPNYSEVCFIVQRRCH